MRPAGVLYTYTYNVNGEYNVYVYENPIGINIACFLSFSGKHKYNPGVFCLCDYMMNWQESYLRFLHFVEFPDQDLGILWQHITHIWPTNLP